MSHEQDRKVAALRDDLLTSLQIPLSIETEGVSPETPDTAGAPAPAPLSNPAICASLRREVRVQFRFMVLHQTFFAVLSLAAVLLLIGAFWRIWDGAGGVEQYGLLAGALLTGGAAGFVTKGVNDSRAEYKAARMALYEFQCAEA
ncbi:hypothetical protein AB0M39_08410 [Streptomyces sp. NPDC051907]|uniref:hypothetical protein n=1 Tax=Streptomyces sp. NPDC051907 TaxID=3155284 RepID=UPI0034204497